MKKQYSKPGIIIEDFRVAEHIAGCPGVKHENYWGTPHQGSPTSCEWTEADGGKIFAIQTICKENYPETIDPENPGSFDGYCYNGAASGMSVFGS